MSSTVTTIAEVEKADKIDKTSFHRIEIAYEDPPTNFDYAYQVTDSIIVFRQVLGALLGLFHCICGGLLAGFSAIFMEQFKENPTGYTISEEEASWIASIVVIPMAPSCLAAGFLINKMPKRLFASLLALIEITGWLIIYYNTSLTEILIGRLLTGIASAGGAPIIPQFIGETSHPQQRGLFLTSVLLGLSLGILIIHVLGALFSWKTCIIITVVILFAYLCLIFYLKEPYGWFLRNHNQYAAKVSFCWYRGISAEAKREISKLIANQHENTCAHYTTKQMTKLLCSRLFLMPLTISATLMITMHFSGNKAIMFHSITILSKSVPSLNQYVSTIIVDVIRVVMTLVGAVLIRKFRVRPLLITSGIGSTASHLFFALFIYISRDNDSEVYSVLALISLIMYIVFSSIGIASLPWVICGEIFPLIVKAIGCGFSTFAYFFSFFLVIKLSPNMFDSLGLDGEFLCFAAFTLVGTLILYFILPETKNLTLKDIEEMFRKPKKDENDIS